MKLLAAVVPFVFLTQVSENTHWDYTDAAVLVSGANIWKVNRAESISKTQPIQVFNQARLAQHKEIKNRNILVFQQGARVALASTDKEKAGISNEQALLDQLKHLGMNLPLANTVKFSTVSPLGTVDELVQAAKSDNSTIRQWNLLGSSMMGPQTENVTSTYVPIPDYSILIEWGNRNSINTAQGPLFKEVSDRPGDIAFDERAIYDRHYDKLPIALEVRASSSDAEPGEEAKLLGKADPLYLVKPKRLNSGYLVYLSSIEQQGMQLIALEVPVFKVTEAVDTKEKQFQVEIPANCFMKNVVQIATRGKGSLTFPDINNPDIPQGTKKFFKNNQNTLTLTLSLTQRAKKTKAEEAGTLTDSARFYLESNDEEIQDAGISYSASIFPVDDVTLPAKDYPIHVFNAACEELFFIPGKSNDTGSAVETK